jgi:hypothetical protein
LGPRRTRSNHPQDAWEQLKCCNPWNILKALIERC